MPYSLSCWAIDTTDTSNPIYTMGRGGEGRGEGGKARTNKREKRHNPSEVKDRQVREPVPKAPNKAAW